MIYNYLFLLINCTIYVLSQILCVCALFCPRNSQKWRISAVFSAFWGSVYTKNGGFLRFLELCAEAYGGTIWGGTNLDVAIFAYKRPCHQAA